MKPAFYQKKWDDLKKNGDQKKLNHLSRQIALTFLDRYFYNDHHEGEYVRLLCEMATFFENDQLNKAGSSALFSIIVEGLCDDFEELQTEAYNRVMSQVVDFCRNLTAGKALNDRLAAFGLTSYQAVFSRIEDLRAKNHEPLVLTRSPKKIFVLSRVTIGADVAITSVLAQRLRRIFPEAEIVLIGGSKLKDVFGGNPDIRIKVVNYSRHGTLLERFSSWFAVLDAIHEETNSRGDEIMVVDPDSRLSQLGVLPLVKNSQYLFFNSRGSDAYPKKLSIAQLTNHWVDQMLGEGDFCYPRVWPSQSKRNRAVDVVKGLRQAGCKKIIVINFGVGGNSRKRLGDAFEEKLLFKLLEGPDTVVIFDQGFGDEEMIRSRELMRSMEKHGFATVAATFEDLQGIHLHQGVVGVIAGIGDLAALISQCDEFIGYDSACQHIAASLGIPTYTIFAGSNNPRFIRRWSACGRCKSEIIHVDTLTHPPMFDTDDVVTRVMDALSE